MRGLLHRMRRQAGITVSETVTAVALMLIVAAVTGSVLVSSTRATASLERETAALDSLRIAMARIEREFRSAECVHEPAPVTPGTPASGDALGFTTRVGGGSQDVEYRVDGGKLLREANGGVQEVATDLVATSAAFTYTETPRRSIVVRFQVRPEHGNDRTLETTVAGRNAWRSC